MTRERQRRILVWSSSGLLVFLVVVLVLVPIRMLLYRESTLVGEAAEDRIAIFTGLSTEVLRDSNAVCFSVARPMRGGPIYLRFQGGPQTADEMRARRALSGPSTKALRVRSSSPPWWQAAATGAPETFDYYVGYMEVWIRKHDYVCFIRISSG